MGMIQKLAPDRDICQPLTFQNRCLRVSIVLGVSAIGLSVPHFREVMAIMASICVTCNNVFFPLFFAHKLEWHLPPGDERRTPLWRRFCHALILTLGLFCFCL